jgi:uncharacterized membrane protein YfcA
LTEIITLSIAMLLTGVVGGVLAGLLGVGGGIVIVPVLEAALAFLGVDASVRMHVAVATSLATIIPTSISSSRAHHARDSVDWGIVRGWWLWILLGTIAGTVIASRVGGQVLAAVFAVMALAVAVKMMFPEDNREGGWTPPKGVRAAPVPSGIGLFSAMMGIGGGTFSVPVMTFLGTPIHRAVGTAALLGLVIALPGTAGYMISGHGLATLPFGSIYRQTAAQYGLRSVPSDRGGEDGVSGVQLTSNSLSRSPARKTSSNELYSGAGASRTTSGSRKSPRIPAAVIASKNERSVPTSLIDN